MEQFAQEFSRPEKNLEMEIKSGQNLMVKSLFQSYKCFVKEIVFFVFVESCSVSPVHFTEVYLCSNPAH